MTAWWASAIAHCCCSDLSPAVVGGRRCQRRRSSGCSRVGYEYVYWMARTKTEQEGSDRPSPIAGLAAKAMEKWLLASGIHEGPLFRAVWDNGKVRREALNDQTVARIIKRRIALAGLDEEMFGGHSLRAGFLAEAGAMNISLSEAMSLSGHCDANTAAIYYRAGENVDNGEDEFARAASPNSRRAGGRGSGGGEP
jgi:integrase